MQELSLTFTIANYTAVAMWLALYLLFNTKFTEVVILGGWFIAGVALVYAVVVISTLFMPSNGGGFTSLERVMLMFDNPRAVLAGWLHYLAFDYFVGVWMVRDADREGFNHWAMGPFLLATLMYGPIGFLAYFIFKRIKYSKVEL